MEGRSYTFGFDSIGNRLQSTVDGRVTTYGSNALNQITWRTTPGAVDVAGMAPTGSTVQVNGQAVSRQGDYYHTAVSVNNATSAVNASVNVTSTAPSSAITRRAFVAKATLGTNEQWQYDADGNLLRDDQWSYTWDAENRLIALETRADLITAGTIATADAKRLEFTYDYMGRRVEKIVRGGWNGTAYATITRDTRFLYNGWNLIGEYAVSGGLTLTRAYTWGLDLAGAVDGTGGVGGLLMAQEGSTQYLYAYDGNGNVQAVINRSSGATVAEYEYSAFGETIRASNAYAATNPFRFSTKYTDNETGLVWYGYRYYSPTTGRFLGRDPSGEIGGLNLRCICNNNLINIWDVLGNTPDYSTYWQPLTANQLATWKPSQIISWYSDPIQWPGESPKNGGGMRVGGDEGGYEPFIKAGEAAAAATEAQSSAIGNSGSGSPLSTGSVTYTSDGTSIGGGGGSLTLTIAAGGDPGNATASQAGVGNGSGLLASSGSTSGFTCSVGGGFGMNYTPATDAVTFSSSTGLALGGGLALSTAIGGTPISAISNNGVTAAPGVAAPNNATTTFVPKPGDVIVYSGNNAVQTAIGALTPGGDAGHVGIALNGGTVLTARPGAGVTIDPSAGALAGNNYVVLRPTTPINTHSLVQWGISQIGTGYNYTALVGVPTTWGGSQTCASLVYDALQIDGFNPPQIYDPTPNQIKNLPNLQQVWPPLQNQAPPPPPPPPPPPSAPQPVGPT